MTPAPPAGEGVLVLYPPGIGYYVDREFLTQMPGFAATYAFADHRIPGQFRNPPARCVFPKYRAIVPGLPGSPLGNRRIEGLDELIGSERPSIIVTYECFSSLSDQVARSPRRGTFRHVVVSYETLPPSKTLWGWFPMTRRFALRTTRTADLVIAHSARAAHGVRSAGVPDDRVLVRAPGVYPALNRSTAADPSVGTGDRRALYVGSLTRNKGVLTVAGAATSNPALPFQFSIVGEGPLRRRLERVTAGLGPRFQILGRVTEEAKQERLAEAAVLIYPSEDIRFGPLTRWEEQTATAAMEAMSAGVPVVASDSGALPEIVGGAGSIFPQGSSTALRQRLAELVNTPGRWAAARAHAIALGATKYDIHACARDVAARLQGLDRA
jgi:glycosyltransferase involved in cell wall biosynthesis